MVLPFSRALLLSTSVAALYAAAGEPWTPGDLGATLLTWLEADPATMYQTTILDPVEADTNPVGRMLDKRVLDSAELITNGTFDTDTTGWSVQSGAAISVVSGALRVENVTQNYRNAYQEFPTVIGKTYVIEITSTTGGTLEAPYVRVGTSLGSNNLLNITSWGPGARTRVDTFVATTTTTFVALVCNNVAPSTQHYDKVSVRELPGITATQATASARPLYRTGAGLPYLQFDGSDDGVGAVLTPSNANVYLLMRTSDTRGALISARNVSNYAGYFIDSSSTPIGQDGVGSPTYVVDGAAMTLRDQMSAAIATGSFLVAEVRGADLSAWSQVSPFTLSSSADFIAGDLAAFIITDAATETTQDRDNIRAYLQGLIP